MLHAAAILVLAAGLSPAAMASLSPAEDPLLRVFQKAVTALSSGDYAAAELGFRQVLKSAPRHVGALGNLGVVYSRTSRPHQAIQTYQRALAIVPRDKSLLLNLGLVYLKQESWIDARNTFARVVELDPENLQARELLATAQLSSGQANLAVRAFEELRRVDHANSGLLYLLGVAYLRQKQPEKARPVLDELIATAEPAKANFVLGKAYYESARFDEAEAYYRKVIGLAATFPGAHLELAKTLISQRDPEAEKELKIALDQDPNDSEALYFLGGFLLQDNRVKEALPFLERARELNPGFWGTYFYLGKARLAMKQAREAVALFEKASALNPGESSAYYQLGRALAQCGRAAEAERAMAKVKELKARELDKAIDAVSRK